MKSLSIIDEKELLLRLRAGDYSAFEKIYSNHKNKITQRLLRLLKSRYLVEDVLQELFIKLWNTRKGIHVEKPIEAYLYHIATNLVNDYFREISTDKKLAEELWYRISDLYNPFDEISQVQSDSELFRSIDKLPEQRKKVFLLCKLEKKSYAEVSRLLQISEAAVNDHITKANRFLRDNYDKAIPFAAVIFCNHLIG
ncbi:sigma-70 family RNA polymerase sigma factor [Pedobacter sp. ISL-68]|uniref:RNA polymerase sigma factor n=1 Tax=unclassified Pedobacter TaxID=2628915 RepID=UPI001BE82605|nr:MULTISPECIES: sigma-70 family RNA polymerase sigma factor [unclassified Pedobacter]MBT2559845.1 sigma-70 family RNA polymerase sigma factor [Pedobacter sp. ISL-64]MBT2592150.1 sigma-70 family RNA polymerase sigma factor [Pedobacter sp. ISL-68]